MGDGESESDVRLGVTPFFDVLKIELRWFSAFPCNKKPDLTSFRVNEGRGKIFRCINLGSALGEENRLLIIVILYD